MNSSDADPARPLLITPWRVVGAMGLGMALACGSAASHAAAPWSPYQLPAEVRGVVGSGDQLSLTVKTDGPDRTVRPGQEYRDGWLLEALTPSEATLSKGGQSIHIGLNPTGALAAKPTPALPSEVTVLLTEDERQRLDALVSSGAWSGQARPGLTQAQTAQFLLNTQQLTAAYQAKLAQLRNGGVQYLGLTADEMRSILGSDAYDQQQDMARILMAQGQIVAFTRPVFGINYLEGNDGVRVTGLTAGGPGQRAGLAVGDLIVKVNGEDAVVNTETRDRTSTAPLTYTLSTGKVITVQPEGYVP